MSNKIEDLCCPQCGGIIGKIDDRTGVCVPNKKPFKVENGVAKLKCGNCKQFVKPQRSKVFYNPLNLPKT